jgi:hypothetical protein
MALISESNNRTSNIVNNGSLVFNRTDSYGDDLRRAHSPGELRITGSLTRSNAFRESPSA